MGERLKSIGLVVGGLALFFALVVVQRPTIFTVSGDGLVYFLPHIRAHTDLALGGHWPLMVWTSGAGWSPFESGQVGPAYLPYHLANLVSRLLGHESWLLELSGWGHIALATFFAHSWLHRLGRWSPWTTAVWALVIGLQPAPFILGINWHAYASPYPWFVYLLTRLIMPRFLERPAAAWIKVAAVNALFFWSAHPHIYAFGIVWVACIAGSLNHEGARWRALFVLFAAQVPHLPSLIHLNALVGSASPEYLADRFTGNFVMSRSQSLGTVAPALFVGNLLGDHGFDHWSTLPGGAGLFFAPLLPVSILLAARRKQWIVAALIPAAVLLLAAKSFTPVAEPLLSATGMRWSWKFAWFLGPTTVVTFLYWFPASLPPRSRPALAVATLLLTVLVTDRGAGFNMFRPAAEHDHVPVEVLLDETRQMLAELSIPPGSRLATAGRWPLSAYVAPRETLALYGVAPTLLGYETVHSYEPLEPASASRAHDGLTVQWRRPVSEEALVERPEEARRELARLRVDALLSRRSTGLRRQQARAVALRERTAFFAEVFVPQRPPAPLATLDGRDVTVQRGRHGSLLFDASSEKPPEIAGREMVWEKAPEGWVGMPVVYARFQPFAHVAAWLLMAAGGWLWVRRERAAVSVSAGSVSAA